jgi:hypothetical protein
MKYLLQKEVRGKWITIKEYLNKQEAINAKWIETNNPNNLTEWRIEIGNE